MPERRERTFCPEQLYIVRCFAPCPHLCVLAICGQTIPPSTFPLCTRGAGVWLSRLYTREWWINSPGFWARKPDRRNPVPSNLYLREQRHDNEAPMPQASPYGKGRWHEVPEGIRGVVFDTANQIVQINPQKGRHLLCSFCPCKQRKQGETSGSAAREERNRQSAAGVPPVSVLFNPSADSR